MAGSSIRREWLLYSSLLDLLEIQRQITSRGLLTSPEGAPLAAASGVTTGEWPEGPRATARERHARCSQKSVLLGSDYTRLPDGAAVVLLGSPAGRILEIQVGPLTGPHLVGVAR